VIADKNRGLYSFHVYEKKGNIDESIYLNQATTVTFFAKTDRGSSEIHSHVPRVMPFSFARP